MGVWLWAMVLQVVLLLSEWREVMVSLLPVLFSVVMSILCWNLMQEIELASKVVMRVHIVVVRESLQVGWPPCVMVHLWQ